MPPKRRTFVLNEMSATSNAPVTPKVARKSGVVTLRRIAMHPGTSVMVVEALKELDSRKGVSKQAIQNFIKRKYPSVDNIRLKYFVRRALRRGLEDGTLVRPANSTVTTGVMGKFRLAPKLKETKAKAENVEPTVQKAPKVAKEVTKEAPKKTKAGGTKKAAADELKLPKKEATKGPNKSKKYEEALPTKVPPAKKPKAKKAANEDVEAKATVRTEAKATLRTKAKPKEVKEVVATEKTKTKPKEAKGKAAKDTDKAAPKKAAKPGRKKNAE